MSTSNEMGTAADPGRGSLHLPLCQWAVHWLVPALGSWSRACVPGSSQWAILRHLVWDLPVRGVICLKISFVCLVVSIQAMPTLRQNGSFHVGFKTAAATFTGQYSVSKLRVTSFRDLSPLLFWSSSGWCGVAAALCFQESRRGAGEKPRRKGTRRTCSRLQPANESTLQLLKHFILTKTVFS